MKQAHRWALTVACGALGVLGAPFIAITATPRNVSYDVAAVSIAGTNNVEVAGTMWWTNLQPGIRGTLAATPFWTISGIGLRWGPNTIVVYGTNALGALVSDSVQVFRYNRDGSGQQRGSKYGLRTQGTLVGWGYSDFGQTDCPASNDYAAITAGRIHSLALRNDGTLVAWGNNYAGQTNCPAGTNYLAVAAGSDHALALQRDGTIVGWGRGDYGQTNCPAGTDYVAVAAGEWHSVALRNDGTLVAWGDNTYGQTNCPAGNDYAAIAALGWHSLALRSDGTLTGWGLGAYGETICPAGSNYVAIATGNSHSLALRSDGTLVGWGLGNWGQTNCPAGTNYVAVAAGSYHSLALRNDGRLVAWGDNGYGQTNCPAGFCTAIAAGGNHNLALYIAPFIDITNAAVAAVMHDITAATIGGTNGPETDITNTVVGAMWWTNALTGARGSFAKAPSWTVGAIALAVGTNTITVSGSNIAGNVSADSVSIIRGPVGTGMPFVDITNAPAPVTYATTSYSVAGTNNVEIMGTLWWTNLQSGARGTLAATPSWTISGIGLRWGPNTIVVYGTNALGTLASDSVQVFRYNRDGSGQQSGSTFGLRPQGTLVSWGDNAYGETNCPAGNNYAAMTVGRYHAVALRSGTTLVGWGDNTYGQTNCPAGSNYLAVAAGWYHTLAVRRDGTLVAWGMNNWGQTNCPAGSNYVAVAAGGFHALAVRNNGTLVGWGSNGSGETNCPPGSTFVALAGGWTHSLALRHDGTLVAWGGNSYGQTNCPAGSNYVAVAAGASHSVALRSDGTLVAWGITIHGETNCPAGSNYVAVAAGLYHSLALRDDGRVVAWGQGTYGETNCPAGAYVAIAAGGYHGLALWKSVPFIDITNADMTAVTYGTGLATIGGTNEPETDITNTIAGALWWSNALTGAGGTFPKAPSWTVGAIVLAVGTNTITVYGSNIVGNVGVDSVRIIRWPAGLGTPFIDVTNAPVPVPYDMTSYTIAGTNNVEVVGTIWWTNLQSGARGTLAATASWTISSIGLRWGPNTIVVYGTNALGMLAADSVSVFRYNRDGSGQQSGSKFGLRSQGTLVGWGDNTYGLTNCPPGNGYAAITAGRYHAVALRCDGVLVAWGDNGNGQTNCPPGSNYVAVAAGWYHTLALRDNGTLVAWGYNASSQTSCPPGSSYVAVAAGSGHSLALRNNGTLLAWGDNTYGQTNCPAGNNYVAVAAGQDHALALRGDGTLTAWGDNGYGQTNCPAGSNYVAIAAGTDHALALRSDGTLVGWGYSSTYGLTNCPAGTNYVAVAAGSQHSLALRSDGALVAWGNNTFGQTNSPAGAYTAIAACGTHNLALHKSVPFVDITNAEMTLVTYDTASATISGTNEPATDITNTVAGTMWWTNALTGARGSFAKAQSWTVSAIALAVGTNTITVCGSNIVGNVGADSVRIIRGPAGTGMPFADLTNAPATVTYDTTSYAVAGTNNANVMGGMSVSNATSGGASTGFAAAPSWMAPATALGIGANTITVRGTNSYGMATNDSVIITRGSAGTGAPFVDVTSTPVAVTYDVTDYAVAGTNNANVVGGMSVSNATIGGANSGFAAAPSWTAPLIALGVGANTITVRGTNSYGTATNDSVTVTRGGIGTGAPFIDITTTPHTVAYLLSAAVVAGTNNMQIAGSLWWTNDRHPADTYALALGFSATVGNLEHGDNLITVAGTNLNGRMTADVVTIHRQTYAEAAPQIATNALLFPTAGSQLSAFTQTNIVWDPARITDAEDGTNLVLTLISVLDAGTTDTVAVVATNISSLLGHAPWTVPLPPEGQTSYVVRFAVVDSTALTNSRVFWNNVFKVVPEPAVLLLTLALVWTMCHVRSAVEKRGGK